MDAGALPSDADDVRGAVRLVLAETRVAAAARELFGGLEPTALTHIALRPVAPFEGPLFELLGSLTGGDVIGLVVPGAWRGPGALALPVRDHVNLALRGPLTGRWPAGEPRGFPCMTGIYQPTVVRGLGGARVYSGDVVVAGVGDARRLTPFERRALGEAGAAAYADCLVPAVIAAAFHGLRVAACVVTQAAHERE